MKRQESIRKTWSQVKKRRHKCRRKHRDDGDDDDDEGLLKYKAERSLLAGTGMNRAQLQLDHWMEH